MAFPCGLIVVLYLLFFGGEGGARPVQRPLLPAGADARAAARPRRVMRRGPSQQTTAGTKQVPAESLVAPPPNGAMVDVLTGPPPVNEDLEDEEILQQPFPEELSDGSTLIVTVDGRITRIGPDGDRYWTAEAGGPMVTSFQNNDSRQERPYAIIPQLDGRGVVHLQGTHKKTFTTIPMSVKAFAELVPQYSHTPDGINYRKDETQLLVYIDWETGASDVTGCREASDPHCLRGMIDMDGGGSNRAQLFLTRTTTTIYATDVSTRGSIFNFSYSEIRPVSMLHPHKVTGPRGGTLLPATGIRINDTLDSFSDGSVLGFMGRANMDTLVFDAFRVSQSMYKGPLSASMGNSLGGAAEDLVVSAPRYPYDPTVIFRKIPVRQHFGNPVSSPNLSGQAVSEGSAEDALAPGLVGNSYYAYASFDSGICDAALSRVLDSEEEGTETLTASAPSGDLISVVNGGSDFGLFAVTYSGTEKPAPWVRGLLPVPESNRQRDGKASANGRPAKDEESLSNGVCFPADSANGFYYGSIPDIATVGETAHQCDASGPSQAPREAGGAQCSASATYFIHEMVSPAGPSGLYSAAGDALSTSSSIGSNSAVDLDMMLFDNVAKYNGGEKPALKPIESAVTQKPATEQSHALNVSTAPDAPVRYWDNRRVLLSLLGLLSLIITALIYWVRRKPDFQVGAENPLSIRPALAIDTNVSSAVAPSGVARIVGNIHITESLLGVGSSGTLVYYGFTSELGVMRPAAIKQMLRSNYSHAIKEIANLQKIDAHDNIVNYYMCEQNDNFVFLALQLCRMNLKDFVGRLEQFLPPGVLRLRLSPAHPDCVRASLLQLAEAIEFLHRKGVVHRDIKPHNILMEEACGIKCPGLASGAAEINDLADLKKFKMRVSDFGLSKDVKAEEVSFGSLSLHGLPPEVETEESGGGDMRPSKPPGSTRHWDAVGTIGWQAPELIRRRRRKCALSSSVSDAVADPTEQTHRLTSKVDIFALGCVFHFTLIPGRHPFGHWQDREDNIMRDNPDLSLLARTLDAYDLVARMIHSDPDLRPTARQVCFHPFFWNSQKRLDFWEAFYVRLKRESVKSRLVRELEAYADPIVCRDIGAMSSADRQCGRRGWGACLDVAFQREIDNPPHGITYDVTSIYSCIRFIRHKKSHFDELDGRLKSPLSMPQGYMRYFESQLPRLFLYSVWFAATHFPIEKEFLRYNLDVLGSAPFFSRDSPPAVLLEFLGTSQIRSDKNLVQTNKIVDPAPLIAERQLPSVVLRTLQGAESAVANAETAATRCRGYYIPPRIEQSCSSSTAVARPPVSAEEGVSDRWIRGVSLGSTHPMTAAGRDAGTETKYVAPPLLCSNVIINPQSYSSRPLHIRKALENERYRTELCREWEESGDEVCRLILGKHRDDTGKSSSQPRRRQCCRFRKGQKHCDYAHGKIELRMKGMQRTMTGVNVGRYISGNIVDSWGHQEE